MERQYVSSSNIASIGYDPDNLVLEITLDKKNFMIMLFPLVVLIMLIKIPQDQDIQNIKLDLL